MDKQYRSFYVNQLDIVLIADRTYKSRKYEDLKSRNLDMVGDEYFNNIYEALAMIGKSVVHYNSLTEFIDNISKHKEDLVLSIYGGRNSRNRLAIVPAICEAYGLKYVGADAYTKILCQDKHLTKLFLQDFGLKIPRSILVENVKEFDLIGSLALPLVVKPNGEGASMGIYCDEPFVSHHGAQMETEKILKKFNQPVLVEEFVSGKEVSVCIAGTNTLINHFEMVEVYIEGEEDYFKNHLYTAYIQRRSKRERMRIITHEIKKQDVIFLKKLFHSLGKMDHIRIDGKLANGKFIVLEMSPTPFLRIGSQFAVSFIQKGIAYPELLKLVINNALNFYHNQCSSDRGS